MELETSDPTFFVGHPFPELKAHFSAMAGWYFSRDEATATVQTTGLLQ